ncbi:MAG: transporter [bacterium]|nr:transporter [bacterium]
MMVYAGVFCSVILGALGQVLMKEAMKIVGPFAGYTGIPDLIMYFVKAVLSLQMFGAVLCYGLSFAVWLLVLSRADLSFARPMVSFGYVIIIVYGYWAGESMSTERVLGISLIMVGLFFVARSAPAA